MAPLSTRPVHCLSLIVVTVLLVAVAMIRCRPPMCRLLVVHMFGIEALRHLCAIMQLRLLSLMILCMSLAVGMHLVNMKILNALLLDGPYDLALLALWLRTAVLCSLFPLVAMFPSLMPQCMLTPGPPPVLVVIVVL